MHKCVSGFPCIDLPSFSLYYILMNTEWNYIKLQATRIILNYKLQESYKNPFLDNNLGKSEDEKDERNNTRHTCCGGHY